MATATWATPAQAVSYVHAFQRLEDVGWWFPDKLQGSAVSLRRHRDVDRENELPRYLG